MQRCLQCSASYDITDLDRAFYAKASVLEPARCPDCRAQQRMAFRNEKTLYKRICDLCGNGIISIFAPGVPFPVYCQECYWGDNWDAADYAVRYDKSLGFVAQFQELLRKTPRLAIINKQSQNSDYCNYSFANKNCYLTFGNHYEEDCMYGRYATKNKSCLDYLWTYNCELCYECLFSKSCYRSVYLDHSENCRECYFSSDLVACTHCLFCSNLRHKQYHILNEPYSESEYKKYLRSAGLDGHPGFSKAKQFFATEFRKRFPARAIYQINCENCQGSNLENCKNLRHCHDCADCEDIAYAAQIDATVSSMDMTCMGYDRGEVCYQTVGCTGTSFAVVCDSCWHCHEFMYCCSCFSSHDCLGCISLKRSAYCILNKQYPVEEYIALRDSIAAEMKNGGAWGEFFPNEISPFAYNETIAAEYYPLSAAKVSALGWRWLEEDKKSYLPQKIVFPESIAQVQDSFCDEVLICDCKRNFKIQKTELPFYRNLEIPIPRKCPDCRHAERMKRRDPRELYLRECAQCGKDIVTPVSPERPERIFCVSCHLAAAV